MGGRARRAIGFAAVGGVAIAGVVAVTSMSASGVEPTETDDPYFEPAGTLAVTLADRAGQVTLFDTEDSIVATQAIETQQPCSKIAFGSVMVPGGGPTTTTGNLLNLTAKVGGTTGTDVTVQLPDDAAGVSSSSTSCGRPDGLVGPGEELELELGAYFNADPVNPAVFIESGSLEIAKTNPQDKDLTVRLIGGDHAGSAAVTEFPVANGGETVLLEDLGLFTGVALGSTATKDNRGLSLAGPGDPNDPKTTTTRFDLVATSEEFDFAVDCGEFVSVEGTYAVTAEFLRAQNGIDLNGNGIIEAGEVKFGDCVDVGVVVEIEEDRVFWNNSTTGVDGSPQDVSGIVTIDFVVERSDPGFPADLEREIDFDADGPFGYIPLSELWCESYSRTDTTGGPILNVDFPEIIVPGDPTGTPIPAPWCLVNDMRHLHGTQISQTIQVVGNGDPWIR